METLSEGEKKALTDMAKRKQRPNESVARIGREATGNRLGGHACVDGKAGPALVPRGGKSGCVDGSAGAGYGARTLTGRTAPKMGETQPRHEVRYSSPWRIKNQGRGRMKFVSKVGKGSVPVEVVAPSSMSGRRTA